MSKSVLTGKTLKLMAKIRITVRHTVLKATFCWQIYGSTFDMSTTASATGGVSQNIQSRSKRLQFSGNPKINQTHTFNPN